MSYPEGQHQYLRINIISGLPFAEKTHIYSINKGQITGHILHAPLNW